MGCSRAEEEMLLEKLHGPGSLANIGSEQHGLIGSKGDLYSYCLLKTPQVRKTDPATVHLKKCQGWAQASSLETSPGDPGVLPSLPAASEGGPPAPFSAPPTRLDSSRGPPVSAPPLSSAPVSWLRGVEEERCHFLREFGYSPVQNNWK